MASGETISYFAHAKIQHFGAKSELPLLRFNISGEQASDTRKNGYLCNLMNKYFQKFCSSPLDSRLLRAYAQGLRYLLCIHLTALALLTVLRGVFYLSVRPQLSDSVRDDLGLTATAFVRGLWFDNVTACYLLLLPLVLVSVAAFSAAVRRRVVGVLGWFLGLMYTLVWAATAANVPYFVYFTKILNSSIWNWAEYGGTTLGMMFGEASYYIYIGVWAACTALFAFALRRAGRRLRCAWSELPPANHRPRWAACTVTLALAAVMVGACLFGIRGRMGYNPIKVSAAYFCNDPILNQLGINPMFALLQSTLDDLRPENRRLHLMNDAEAVRGAQRLLGRTGITDISPLARHIETAEAPTGHNVVLVLMESMSAELTGVLGGTSLTPHLDSLAHRGRLFTHCFSAGNHTNHGLYATLYSFPSILKRNAMKGTNIPRYDGLATVLQDAGYRTLFFMTHETQYDNMNAFLRTNGFDEVYGQENYPRKEVVNHFGVPDDFLFRYALPVLRERAKENRPFFATLLTISNHPPYVLPEGTTFRPRSKEMEAAIVEYADWSIGQFMQAAARESWFANTLFVFLGDHGKMVGQADCELPISYNHIPLIICGPDIAPAEDAAWAGQVDVAPTLLGLLRVPYVQNNFGIDLLREQRPCIFYSADNTLAARNGEYLYVFNPDAEREFCYRLDPLQPKATPQPVPMGEAHRSLRKYLFSMLQTTEYMVEKGMTQGAASVKITSVP